MCTVQLCLIWRLFLPTTDVTGVLNHLTQGIIYHIPSLYPNNNDAVAFLADRPRFRREVNGITHIQITVQCTGQADWTISGVPVTISLDELISIYLRNRPVDQSRPLLIADSRSPDRSLGRLIALWELEL